MPDVFDWAVQLKQSRISPLGWAFLLAPLTPGAVVMLISVAAGNLGEGLWACMIVLPVSYGAVLMPGVPLYWFAHKHHWFSRWTYIAMGLLCALAASVALWWGTFADRLASENLAGWLPFVGFSVVAGVFGGLTGLVFWALERPGNNAA